MQNPKRVIVGAIQVLVTVGMMYWLFRDPALRVQIWNTLLAADKRWFLAGLLAYGVVALLGSLRLYLLLSVQEIRLTYSRVLGLFMIGAFFNLFMLGTVGGDVVKLFYILKETAERKAAAFLAVLMDRLIGLIALIALSATIIGFQYSIFLAAPDTRALLITVALLLTAATGALAVSIAVTAFNLVHRLPKRLPAREKLVELSAAYRLYGHAWKTSLLAFLLSTVSHLGSFISFYFAARAFTNAITLGNMITVMPIVNTLTALPISVAGVGVRENLFQRLLGHLYGISDDVAILVSLTGFMIIAAASLMGGLVYLVYRPSSGSGLRGIRNEVRAVEEGIVKP